VALDQFFQVFPVDGPGLPQLDAGQLALLHQQLELGPCVVGSCCDGLTAKAREMKKGEGGSPCSSQLPSFATYQRPSPRRRCRFWANSLAPRRGSEVALTSGPASVRRSEQL
jgi:hypothetical protein